MNSFMSHPTSACSLNIRVCKSIHVNTCISGNVCACVCVLLRVFPYSQLCKCSFMFFFPNVCFFNLLHFKGAHGELGAF